jgi:AcrR family transcriptional regulator
VKVRTEARHDHILDIAGQVFLETGYERASMSEIARRVGGSKATLYGYFPSKDALFLAVLLNQTQRLREATEAVAASTQPGQLRQELLSFGEGFINFLGSELGLAAHRMVLAEAGRSEIGRRFYDEGPKRGAAMMARALQAAMTRGELRPADADVAARHLTGLLLGEVHERWFDPELPTLTAPQARAMAERSVEVFLRAYAV